MDFPLTGNCEPTGAFCKRASHLSPHAGRGEAGAARGREEPPCANRAGAGRDVQLLCASFQSNPDIYSCHCSPIPGSWRPRWWPSPCSVFPRVASSASARWGCRCSRCSCRRCRRPRSCCRPCWRRTCSRSGPIGAPGARRTCKVMIPSMAVGIAIAYLFAASLSAAHIRLAIGIIIAIFVLRHWLGTMLRSSGAAAEHGDRDFFRRHRRVHHHAGKCGRTGMANASVAAEA